jgi:cobalt-zinc-cadmium efflux system membrane fusion protein
VTEKHIALGEAVKEDANIFIVTDLSSVWAQIIVSAKDLNVVRVGAHAAVMAAAFDSRAAGTVSYVGSLLGEQTRSANARVTLNNPQLAWRPGMFVNVDIVTGSVDAKVAVNAEAVQKINDKPTVFVRIPGGFIAQPVETGIADGKRIEIVSGIKPGSQYASKGSFVLKAELGKASLEND